MLILTKIVFEPSQPKKNVFLMLLQNKHLLIFLNSIKNKTTQAKKTSKQLSYFYTRMVNTNNFQWLTYE
jgi:hypothetical protein